MKLTIIFDLDETVINSSHRTPNNPDGTLNLDAYIALHTAENVAKDTLLPLAQTMRDCILAGHDVVILTARDMAECDYLFLAKYGIHPNYIFSRDRCNDHVHYKMKDGPYKVEWLRKMPEHLKAQHIVMFDDSAPVKAAMRRAGVTTLCAHKVNKKLFVQARYK